MSWMQRHIMVFMVRCITTFVIVALWIESSTVFYICFFFKKFVVPKVELSAATLNRAKNQTGARPDLVAVFLCWANLESLAASCVSWDIASRELGSALAHTFCIATDVVSRHFSQEKQIPYRKGPLFVCAKVL